MIRHMISTAVTLSPWVAICVLCGCTTHGRSNTARVPIVGTWVLSPSQTGPAAAADPAIARSVAASIEFSPNGTFHSTATFNGNTIEDRGTWRVAGSDAYAKSAETKEEQRYEVRGDVLTARGKNGLDVLIFERDLRAGR